MEKEFDAAQRDGGGGAGDFLFQGEMKEILAQFLLGNEVGGFAVVSGQSPDGPDITGLSFGRQTMELHILQESSTQRCHVILSGESG